MGCIPRLCAALANEFIPRILECVCLAIGNVAAMPQGREILRPKIIRPLVGILTQNDHRVRAAALLAIGNLALDGMLLLSVQWIT